MELNARSEKGTPSAYTLFHLDLCRLRLAVMVSNLKFSRPLSATWYFRSCDRELSFPGHLSSI